MKIHSRAMRLRLIIIFAAVLGGACDSGNPAEPSRLMNVGTSDTRANLVDVSGHVLDFTTGAAMPGATVTFRSLVADDAAIGAATADAQGVYRLAVPAGTYRVNVDGITATTLTVSRATTHSDILARAGLCSALYGFVMEARSGRPIAGVDVSVGTAYRTTTDARGWYRLDFMCDASGGFGTTIAAFTQSGYDPVSSVIGRGFPRGALRRDVGMLRPDAD